MAEREETLQPVVVVRKDPRKGNTTDYQKEKGIPARDIYRALTLGVDTEGNRMEQDELDTGDLKKAHQVHVAAVKLGYDVCQHCGENAGGIQALDTNLEDKRNVLMLKITGKSVAKAQRIIPKDEDVASLYD